MNDIVKDLMQAKERAYQNAKHMSPMVTYVPESLYNLAKEKAEKQGKTLDEIGLGHIEPIKSYIQ